MNRRAIRNMVTASLSIMLRRKKSTHKMLISKMRRLARMLPQISSKHRMVNAAIAVTAPVPAPAAACAKPKACNKRHPGVRSAIGPIIF